MEIISNKYYTRLPTQFVIMNITFENSFEIGPVWRIDPGLEPSLIEKK
jgi:hypothetical protein